MTGADERLTFLGWSDAARRRVRTLVLQPGDALDYDRDEWVDTLVVVERGELEVECCTGARARFATGAVVAFAGLPLRRLHNTSDEQLVLSAVSRP